MAQGDSGNRASHLAERIPLPWIAHACRSVGRCRFSCDCVSCEEAALPLIRPHAPNVVDGSSTPADGYAPN